MNSIEHILKRNELKCTPGRESVLRILLNAGKPLSQSDIQKKLTPGSFDRVNIYRTLHTFTQKGITHRVHARNRSWLFEYAGNCEHDTCHLHFTCTGCNTITCLDIFPPMAEVPDGYRIERQKVYVEGVCPNCAKGEHE